MFRRKRKQSDFKAEIEAHLILETDRLREQGLGEAEAQTAARLAFGNVALANERFYEASPWSWWENLATDVRYALRGLARAPGFTAAVLAALALGIGANTALFTVVNTVLLQSLPYPNADRIVTIDRPQAAGVSVPMFTYWEQNNPGFIDLAAYQAGVSMNADSGDKPELVEVIKASRNYFRLFGGNPILGRTFAAEEDQPGGRPGLVISYGLWQRRLAGDRSILGKAIRLGGSLYTVIGVLAPGFHAYPPADVWMPLQADPNSVDQTHILTVSGRLSANTTLAKANSQMALIGKQYVQSHPQQLGGEDQIEVALMQEQMTGDIRPALLVLLGAVGLVLLIACANVANLLLARATGRQREIAVRIAIGAGRGRIVRQLLTESLLLAFIGGIAGLALGSWGVHALLKLSPGDLPRLQEMTSFPALDPWVAGFTFVLAAVTGVLFGVFPALALSRPDLASSLKESRGQGGTALKHNRVRGALVAAEVAVAVVLLCGAVLLIRSFAAMHNVRLGFDPHNLLTMQVSLAGSGYSESSKVDRLAREFEDRAVRIPGVESAAIASSLPLWSNMDMVFDIPGRPPIKGRKFTGDVQWRIVSAHYFDVLRIPLVSGRLLRAGELGRTVVINQTMAHKFWPDADPLGQTIMIGHGLGPLEQGVAEVVGVVGDVRELHLSRDAPSIMYQAPSQIPDSATLFLNSLEPKAVMVRTRPGVAAMSVSEAVQQALLAGDRLPATKVRTMEEAGLDSTARQNFNVMLLGLFATIALMLAAVGIYGVMSYTVEQRTHEIGIRAALGASRRHTLSLVLLQAFRMTLIGVAAGVAASFGFTRLMTAQLFGVKPSDPVTFVAVPLILLAVAIAAAFVPALRASSVNPIVALRHE